MDENKKKLVETLTRGRNSAKRLQNLLRRKDEQDESVFVDDLVMEVMGSFASGLSVLSSFHFAEIYRVPVSPRVDLACSVDRKPEIFSGEAGEIQAPVIMQRRGCYKRRRTEDSRVKTSVTIEDGYAWRKYGQKEILNSKFPRCYFRCTHKHVVGCKASKQVQKLEDEPNMFHITYFGYHTCSPSYTSSHPGVSIDHMDSKIYRNFQIKSPSITRNVHNIDPSLGQDISSTCGTQSSSALLWKEIMDNEVESFKSYGSLSDIPLANVFFF